jgi:hypothetical protein
MLFSFKDQSVNAVRGTVAVYSLEAMSQKENTCEGKMESFTVKACDVTTALEDQGFISTAAVAILCHFLCS